MEKSLWFRIQACILESDAVEKATKTRAMVEDFQQGMLSLKPWRKPIAVNAPGRPSKPELVNPGSVAKRKLGSVEGRAIMMHAIAHIEFNAINLALDAAQRFPDMPDDFYADWLQVADEEAQHFMLVREHLLSLGYDYGDFKAHNGLWEMAESTAHDVLERMALVPRVLEARGLDVTPSIQQRFAKVGDMRAVEILDVIFKDELGHVAIGSRWYKYCCEQRGIDPQSTFFALIDKHFANGLSGPFNMEARQQAGFSEAELALLLQ